MNKIYPKEFVEEVRAEFDDNHIIHSLLKINSMEVGYYWLNMHKKIGLTPEEVVSFFDDNKEQLVKKAAEHAIKCRKLYYNWLAIIKNI
ncbi:MAG: hypothetical protein L3J07_02925 [Candidatus Magasanikbacteria bacterium]|nr:hypothetical protein [Candidatus Magasanikbacteria bacterium]